MSVKIEDIEPTLAKAWQQIGSAAQISTVNVIALCAEPARFEATRQTLSEVLPSHPGRAIIAVLRGGSEARIEASAQLACDDGRGREACGEEIVLDVHGGAVAWLPTAIERLLRPGSRVNLWWVGDLPDDYALYDKLTETVDRVTVNSEDIDLRDVRTLASRIGSTRGRYALGDMNWVRLRMWQELLARFFDHPAVLAQLPHARTLTITATDHRRPARAEEPAGTQGLLFAAWFAQRIGARTSQAKWTKPTGAIREVEIPRDTGGVLTVRFETAKRDDVFPGAIVGISLQTDEGAHFEIGREHDNHRVLGWSGTCSGAVIPKAVMRTDILDNAHMLARELARPVRDPLFEACLAAAADLAAAAGA